MQLSEAVCFKSRQSYRPDSKSGLRQGYANKNFTPEKYFSLESKESTGKETVELISAKRFSENEIKKAEALCEKYNSLPAVVTSVKSKKSKIGPGKLYSLTKLQNYLSKKYKMTMNESLSIAQSLYTYIYLSAYQFRIPRHSRKG